MIRPKTLELPANQVTTFVALAREASRLEVEDAFFNTASAVFLPDVPGSSVLGGALLVPFTNLPLLAAMARAHQRFTTDMLTVPFDPDTQGQVQERDIGLHVILAALRFLEKNPSHRLVIAGHTDRAGDDAFNDRLSAARGRSVLAVLEGNRTAFVSACAAFHAPEDDPIVLRFAARTRGFPTEPASDRAATPGEIRAFQRAFNDAFGASITVDGVVGDETRGAYFDLYQDDLDTTAGGKEAMRALRAQLRFVDPSNKVLPLGERFPRENPAQDGLRSQRNRRVELLFFSPPRLPTVSAKDAGEELFRRKLFSFRTLDRDALAAPVTAESAVGAAPAVQLVAAPAPAPGVVEPAGVFATTMPNAGVQVDGDVYAFLEPFQQQHPGDGHQGTREDARGATPPALG